jgi:uncharacterized membrane protein YccF (DUF307 family)
LARTWNECVDKRPTGRILTAWIAQEELHVRVALAVTIIGIPLALADLKLIPVSLVPPGRVDVLIDQRDRSRPDR